MKQRIASWLTVNLFLACCPVIFAQGMAQSQSTENQAALSAPTDTQEKNIQEYIDLLRTDVRQQKAEVMGAEMALSADQSAKFWPIYNEYDKALNTLNDQRVANIQEYARDYDHMTDAKADELVRSALDYRKQRSELLRNIMTALRRRWDPSKPRASSRLKAVALDHHLRIDAALPIVGQGSMNSTAGR